MTSPQRISPDTSTNAHVKTVLTGLAMGESPRWHADRLWLCDWGAREILAVDDEGSAEVVRRTSFDLPFSIDWLRDGRLLVISGRDGQLLVDDGAGSLVVHTDLRQFGEGFWNEIVVDRRGTVYVNGGPGIAILSPDGGAPRLAAETLAFPNGMAVTADNATLIVAESHAKRLTAFDVRDDGSLANRRVWADLGAGVPDGICVDAESCVWYADVPNKRCVRVREGGDVLQVVDVDRGCFACMLGGPDRRTLFMVAAEWRGMDKIAEVARARTGRVLAVDVTTPGAGHP